MFTLHVFICHITVICSFLMVVVLIVIHPYFRKGESGIPTTVTQNITQSYNNCLVILPKQTMFILCSLSNKYKSSQHTNSSDLEFLNTKRGYFKWSV